MRVPSSQPQRTLLSVYLVSVSGEQGADLSGRERANRNPAKAVSFMGIRGFRAF